MLWTSEREPSNCDVIILTESIDSMLIYDDELKAVVRSTEGLMVSQINQLETFSKL